MAQFQTKSIKEIYDNFISKYTIMRNQYGDNTPLLQKAFVKSIGYAIAGVAGSLWRLASWCYKQCFVQTCDLPALKLWGNLVEVDYNYGRATNIVIKLTNVSASSLNSGTVFKDLNSGNIYKTISQATRRDNLIYTTAECTKSGTDGNIPVGTILNIANPLDGIPLTGVVESVLIEGSEDEETESYRKRVLNKFRSKAQGGSALDYYNWVLEVPGIVDALIYTLEEGLVDIFLVANGSGRNRNPSGNISPNPFPSWVDGEFQEYTGSGLMLQVAKAIEGTTEGANNRRPMCARVRLRNPNYTAFSVEIGGLSTVEYNTQIKNALITTLDSKRPHLRVLGYKEANAKINALSLSGEISELIGESETFTSFVLKNSNGVQIDEATLGVGCLAYLSALKINGTSIQI